MSLLAAIGVDAPTSRPAGQLLLSLVLYGLMITMLVAIMNYRKPRVTRHDMGLSRLLQWKDIAFALAGIAVYLLLTFVGLKIAALFPGFDATQAQSTGLGQMFGIDRALAFFSIAVITPVLEELIFRGLIYGRMRRIALPWWVPAIVVSALFGVAHMQWNVGVDVFCMSLVLCFLREVTGSIWSGILAHIIKNSVAFFVVFGLVGM